ncbi:MAG: hypothetical protein ABSG72_10525 [Candidatus Sulfotelmatobacter sp.]
MSRSMSMVIVLLLGSCAVTGFARAQDDADDDKKIACYTFPKSTESYKKKLWDGYEISLGPARNASGGGGDDCTAAIYNSAGKVVFRTTGFGVIFDQKHTGMDFDGDGKGEVVFETDQAGGAHCCWVYNVVTLSPKPHRLFDVGEGAAVDFVKEKDGRVTIWDRVGETTEYTSSAARPYVERALRFEGTLVDVTPEFCGKLLSADNPDYSYWTSMLTAENIRKLQGAKFKPAGQNEVEEIASALLARAGQKVLCRRYDDALADLNLWPEDSRNDMKNNFAASITEYSPEFAAQLETKASQ